VGGLSGMPKLLFVDAGLYGYLVVRPLAGIGFDFRLNRSDVTIGLREFLYFTPIALGVGFALAFLHLHRTPGSAVAFAAGWLFTLFFVALPEELFFRGLMMNMLERRVGVRRALVITALLFGLAHFNKRAEYFSWRYVILAAIAGVFYGRAWLARRRLLASSITHATVDTVWSIWLR
jgi:membrane protease YdiL (CAAX protease family)